MKTYFKKYFQLKNVIPFLGIILLISNLFFLGVYIINKHIHRYDVYYEPGYQFLSFKEPLKGVKKVGYITSKDSSREKNDGFFLQAQYFLAPTLLEADNADHKYVIIDSENVDFILLTMQMLKAKRVTNNDYGQALLMRMGL